MAAELGLMSLTQLQKLAQFQQQQQQKINNSSSISSTSGMWNSKQVLPQDDDDSWEVRAFEQDSGNVTWPPRSYTCTFCRREFRSAQALGGHMNVHRRDRARLHQTPIPGGNNNPTSSSLGATSTLLIPAQDFVTSGGLCLLYSLPNPNGVVTPTTVNSYMDSPSTPLSVSPFATNNLISPCPPNYTYPVTPHSVNSSICQSSNTEPSASNSNDDNLDNSEIKKDSTVEELDLELRLGRR